MAIQILDERISIASTNNSKPLGQLSPTPALIGDIGLQVGAAIPTGNTGSVRVALAGIVNLTYDLVVNSDITITVERNSNGTAGTGVVIYTQAYSTGGETIPPLSIIAGDFPPIDAVLSGQIRYSMFISSPDSGVIFYDGPIVFNGSASAGTTTS
ncbi:hypothetical protein [Cohnella zeiphila]|uniref:Uncharacterized protein n=1 Tax=Cohnella zeiphila TaxID=2761120 RepID=A0A7X0VUB7_9BACL|nr:hypothetical protein [Cohnella zeiphila]MBB6730839.1 hypothetical protein [Cohnella zeiphila]